MTAAKRRKAPDDPLYHRVRVPAPQGLSLPETLEWLRVKPGELKDTLDSLVAWAHWWAARHPATPIAEEAEDVVTEISCAIGMRGEARDLQFISVGQAIERLNVQCTLGPEMSEKVRHDRVRRRVAVKGARARARLEAKSRKMTDSDIEKEIRDARIARVPGHKIADKVATRLRLSTTRVRQAPAYKKIRKRNSA